MDLIVLQGIQADRYYYPGEIYVCVDDKEAQRLISMGAAVKKEPEKKAKEAK
jgi:hypothetical protein